MLQPKWQHAAASLLRSSTAAPWSVCRVHMGVSLRRATAVAARYLGLDCHLLLRTSKALVDKDPGLVGEQRVLRLDLNDATVVQA